MFMSLMVGGLSLISGDSWARLGVHVVEDGVETRGLVIDINKKDIYRAPVVRFTAEDGKSYVFVSQFDRNMDLFDLEVGQEIEIVYERTDPARAQENTFWGRWGPRVIPAIFGIMIFFAGLFTFTRGKKR